MTPTEAHRLAAAANALRPDWPLGSLSAFIANHLASRAYRDAAVALAWVATDPQTKAPGRVLEAGPWWRAVMADGGTVSAVTTRCPVKGHDSPAWNCAQCAEGQTPPPESWREVVAASMQPRPRPVAAREPTSRDLAVYGSGGRGGSEPMQRGARDALSGCADALESRCIAVGADALTETWWRS